MTHIINSQGESYEVPYMFVQLISARASLKMMKAGITVKKWITVKYLVELLKVPARKDKKKYTIDTLLEWVEKEIQTYKENNPQK